MPRLLPVVLLAALAASLPAAPAEARDPKLTVSAAKLRAALKCDREVTRKARVPLLFVTGTGTTALEGFNLVEPALKKLGRPLCTVDFPDYTTADIQVSAQYLVDAIRRVHRAAGRPIAIYGISQGGLLPRWALTFWPSLRPKVADVVAVAGTMHGTTMRSLGGATCASAYGGCPPAIWQQFSNSNLIRALDRQRDESPGRTSWTTVRTIDDDVVQPQVGPRAASSLKGATNIAIQGVCPGRVRLHLDSYADSVALAALEDAITHKGGARTSRFPKDVCARNYGPGLGDAALEIVREFAPVLITSRRPLLPHVLSEPPVRSYARR